MAIVGLAMPMPGMLLVALMICVMLFLQAVRAGPPLELLGDFVVDPAALTMSGIYGPAINGMAFQQEMIVSSNGFQYVAYYNANRHVCLARRKLPQGPFEIIEWTDYRFASDDAHNTISIGICESDGTIHLAFDHHAHPLHYRVSRPGVASRPQDFKWSVELFGPVLDHLVEGTPIKELTYPRFLSTADGCLRLFYRSGRSAKGDEWIATYRPQSAWTDAHEFISGQGVFREGHASSDSRNAYPNYTDCTPDGKIVYSWVWREQGMGNHGLALACSADGGKSWQNSAGVTIASHNPADPSKDRVISIDSPGLNIVQRATADAIMNTQGQACDSKGNIHIVMWHSSAHDTAAATELNQKFWGTPGARRYHHYWLSTDGSVHHAELPGIAGNRPRLLADRSDNLWLVCAVNATDEYQNSLYFLRGTLVIYRATAAARWRDWQIVQSVKGPFMNEMLSDPNRLRKEDVLSIVVQNSPATAREPTAIRVVDFKIK